MDQFIYNYTMNLHENPERIGAVIELFIIYAVILVAWKHMTKRTWSAERIALSAFLLSYVPVALTCGTESGFFVYAAGIPMFLLALLMIFCVIFGSDFEDKK